MIFAAALLSFASLLFPIPVRGESAYQTCSIATASTSSQFPLATENADTNKQRPWAASIPSQSRGAILSVSTGEKPMELVKRWNCQLLNHEAYCKTHKVRDRQPSSLHTARQTPPLFTSRPVCSTRATSSQIPTASRRHACCTRCRATTARGSPRCVVSPPGNAVSCHVGPHIQAPQPSTLLTQVRRWPA